MTYGPPKITSDEIKREILEEISTAIDRNSDFTSGNLAFYGYSCQFEINLILQARGPSSFVGIRGQKSREQTLEPGESPPQNRREFIEQWLTELEAKDGEITAETMEDFLTKVPTDEPAPVAELIKAKGKKGRGATKGA